MARQSFVQINGKLYERGVDTFPEETNEARRSAVVRGDIPDFISPIDGTVVAGRAAMRDHCKRHDVVPTQELKGLPTERPQTAPDRGAIREAIRRQLYK